MKCSNICQFTLVQNGSSGDASNVYWLLFRLSRERRSSKQLDWVMRSSANASLELHLESVEQILKYWLSKYVL